MNLSARDYHRTTSYVRHEMRGGMLDWGTQPDVFKSYGDVPAVGLPDIESWPEETLSEILAPGRTDDVATPVNLERLGRILALTEAITAKTRYGGTEFYFRSVASAGALYPFEIYVGAVSVAGLDQGLYHYDVAARALVRLRSGSLSGEFSSLVADPDAANPSVIFFLTSIFFRSSWKYRDRAYRYNLLDTGHLAENLFLALRSERLPFKLRYDFDDAVANEVLRIDPEKEVCLAVGWVEERDHTIPASAEGLTDLRGDLAARSVVSRSEADYPSMRRVHESSSRVVRAERPAVAIAHFLGVTAASREALPETSETPGVLSYAESVMRRRSMRNFVRTRLSSAQFSALLRVLCFGKETGSDIERLSRQSVSVGFFADNVEGQASGLYLLDRDTGSIGLVRRGSHMGDMADVCLDQGWLSNCALHFLFMTNLELLEEMWGSRGYRYAMLSAGRLGQRLYLACTSMKLGCCGIGALYDDEAAQLIGLNRQSALLYLVAAGPVKKWTGAE